jgi:geranylgeranyl pyrophosphate synthase
MMAQRPLKHLPYAGNTRRHSRKSNRVIRLVSLAPAGLGKEWFSGKQLERDHGKRVLVTVGKWIVLELLGSAVTRRKHTGILGRRKETGARAAEVEQHHLAVLLHDDVAGGHITMDDRMIGMALM